MNNYKTLMTDVVEWDVPNWSRAIEAWKCGGSKDNLKGKRVLDLGGRFGGLSLYFALSGATVICSDLEFIKDGSVENAKALHNKYGVSSLITYEDIDATDIPYENEFDIICFKSIMGGVGYDNNYENQLKMMQQIRKALKPGGKCYFVENLVGCRLVQFLRKKLRPWGSHWRYISLDELAELTDGFKLVKRHTFGVIGLMGPNKLLSTILSSADKALEKVVKPHGRYILSCVLEKEE